MSLICPENVKCLKRKLYRKSNHTFLLSNFFSKIRSLPPGKTQYLVYRRLDGPQGRSGQVRKTLSPTGFDRRTVQPVASR